MVLDNFFTMTEMKVGLVQISRIEELVSAMQEKDSTVLSVDEKARRWSTVASVLAATESMSILNRFIQLGGLDFLDQWLQEALQLIDRTGDSSLDDSTCELLRALEKLSPDSKAPFFSGIMVSIKNLIGYKSLKVQERATALYDLLSHGTEKECNHLDSDKSGGCHDEAMTSNATVSLASSTVECSTVNVSSAESGIDEDKQAIVLTGSELKCPISSDFSQSTSMKRYFSARTRRQVDSNDSIIKVSPVQPNLYLVEESSTHLAGETNSAGTWTKSAEENSEKFVGNGISHVTSLSGVDCVSPVNTLDTQSVTEPAVVKGADVEEGELSANPSDDVEAGLEMPNHSNTEMKSNIHEDHASDHRTTGQNDGNCSNQSHELSVTGYISRKMENINTSFPGEAKDVNVFAPDILAKEGRCEDSATTGGILKSTTDVTANEIVNSRMDVDPDAQKVTRQVAKVVEGEVSDCKEPFNRFASSKNPEAKVVEQGSSGAVISSGEDRSIDSKNAKEPGVYTSNQNLSQVVETADETADEKKAIYFDLNEDSTDAPSCDFDGKAACSVSAAPTAICPSSVRVQDAQKAFSVVGSNSLKHRQDFVDIDLNVADGNYEGTTNALLVEVPESSGLPSGESSVEVCSKNTKMLKLDLNNVVEDGDHSSSHVSMQPSMKNLDLNDNPPSDHDVISSCGGLQAEDNYVFIMGKKVWFRRDAIPQTRPFLQTEPVVTPLTRSFLSTEPDVTPHTSSFLSKEPFPLPSICANYAQSSGGAQAYVPHSPGYGYTNHHMEPFMTPSSEMYAPAVPPYMVDPRTFPTRQQAMGASVTAPPSYSISPFPMSTPAPPSYSISPFPMSTPTTPSGFNWVGSSQPNVDVSSGLFISEVENREQGTSRQLFPEQANMAEEQTSSRLKRKEPDNGCDPHPGVYRRQPPWL